MILAIQEAYYLHARNPSDISTLVQIAHELGLDSDAFATAPAGPGVEALLQVEIAFSRSAPINGFPSLVLQTQTGLHAIDLNYLDAAPMRLQIEAMLRNVVG